MSQTLTDLFETLKKARESYGILDIFPDDCLSEDSILGESVILTPDWWIQEERKRRGTGVPVDLGLSVLWSSRNVGAASGEQPGLYVGWGDTTGKLTSTDPDDYPSSNPPRDIGGTEYDIAREMWAETWRLPTRAEMKELMQKCQWRWTVINGNPGAQIIGRNGASIFLPAAGDRYGTDFEDAFYYGRYWTSELRPDDEDSRRAYLLEFSQMGPDIVSLVRHMGMSVRPVLEK